MAFEMNRNVAIVLEMEWASLFNLKLVEGKEQQLLVQTNLKYWMRYKA